MVLTKAPSEPASVQCGPRDPRPTLVEERRLWKAGHEWVAGLDEVGRGAWAGPLTVGAAVVRPGVRRNSLPTWLRDSKLLLEERRESIFEDVGRWCAAWSIGHASASECDRWGMTAAQRLASYRALAGLAIRPDAILLDGPFNFLRPPLVALQRSFVLGDGYADEASRADELPLPEVELPDVVTPLVDADARCAVVAAASVLAKVVRDRIMREESEHFPLYHFDSNKGYPSPLHKTALRGYGLSAIHRRSWAFVEWLPWR
jgi:ribonuclease HII